jgi:hypothetical protein
MDDDGSRIAEKFEALRGVMDEQMRRLWARQMIASTTKGLRVRCARHR